MSSVEQFPARVERLEDLSTPFREALSKRVHEDEAVIDLMFSPAFRAGKFSSLASALCITENRWFVVLSQEDGSTTVETASYESTLLLELTIILLYGQLKMDFVVDGQVRSTAIQFNTVMKDEYCEILQNILDRIDNNIDKAPSSWGASDILRQWPIKFRNVSNIYAPRNSRLLDGIQWSDIYGGFHRQLAPAGALLLTDRHIIVITEEKPYGWFQFRERSHYGEIITYFPLDRLANFRINEHSRFDILEIVGHEGHGSERLEVILPRDQKEGVTRLMKEASFAPCFALVNKVPSRERSKTSYIR
jgi:hypothetical protein